MLSLRWPVWAVLPFLDMVLICTPPQCNCRSKWNSETFHAVPFHSSRLSTVRFYVETFPSQSNPALRGITSPGAITSVRYLVTSNFKTDKVGRYSSVSWAKINRDKSWLAAGCVEGCFSSRVFQLEGWYTQDFVSASSWRKIDRKFGRVLKPQLICSLGGIFS